MSEPSEPTRLIPDAIRDAILGRPICDLCGTASIQGRPRHLICELIAQETP